MKTIFQKIGMFASIAAFIFLTQSCTAQQKIPAHWTAEMKLTLNYGGGMRYYSYAVEFNSAGGTMQVNDEGVVTKYKLILSPQQLDEILQFLIKRNFSRIESEYSGITYDKGTENIMLNWDGKFVGATESSSMSIKEKYRTDFNEVQNYLFQLAEKVRAKE